ncbi:hypothetical protein KNO15_04925 [Leifsonia shinshuensis]|uniref:hypothetical protein n=1 Tax=Leifsonia shinshuensis TaxID=150026 RepID=UPI001F50CC09|nr:hypothetical protein [Leifsonia shinshuensis]MCI0156037.1 hypothetical protein [Leifsonia shinshuensis]
MVEAQERDAVEGRYTQAEPETAEGRTVHGQYTEGEGHAGPDTEIAGAYVGSQREGRPPIVRSTHQRIGNYQKADHDGHRGRKEADTEKESGTEERAGTEKDAGA